MAIDSENATPPRSLSRRQLVAAGVAGGLVAGLPPAFSSCW